MGYIMSMTVSMDDALKSDFSAICAEIGMSASTAVNIFAKRVVRDKRIPFDLTSQTEADREYERACRAYEREVNEGLWRGYRDFQEGRTHDWEDVKAELGLVESLDEMHGDEAAA